MWNWLCNSVIADQKHKSSSKIMLIINCKIKLIGDQKRLLSFLSFIEFLVNPISFFSEWWTHKELLFHVSCHHCQLKCCCLCWFNTSDFWLFNYSLIRRHISQNAWKVAHMAKFLIYIVQKKYLAHISWRQSKTIFCFWTSTLVIKIIWLEYNDAFLQWIVSLCPHPYKTQ